MLPLCRRKLPAELFMPSSQGQHVQHRLEGEPEQELTPYCQAVHFEGKTRIRRLLLFCSGPALGGTQS